VLLDQPKDEYDGTFEAEEIFKDQVMIMSGDSTVQLPIGAENGGCATS